MPLISFMHAVVLLTYWAIITFLARRAVPVYAALQHHTEFQQVADVAGRAGGVAAANAPRRYAHGRPGQLCAQRGSSVHGVGNGNIAGDPIK